MTPANRCHRLREQRKLVRTESLTCLSWTSGTQVQLDKGWGLGLTSTLLRIEGWGTRNFKTGYLRAPSMVVDRSSVHSLSQGGPGGQGGLGLQVRSDPASAMLTTDLCSHLCRGSTELGSKVLRREWGRWGDAESNTLSVAFS